MIVIFYALNPPVGDLVANPSRLSLKNPTEWRATLPLGGLAAVQYSPKFQKNPTEWRATLPLGGLAAVQYSPKFEKSYRVVSNPLTRGLATVQNSPKFKKILPSDEQTSHSGA